MLWLLLKTTVPPMILTGLFLFISWRLWKRDADPFPGGAWGGPIGISVSFFVGFVLVHGAFPAFLPGPIDEWLPYIGLLAGTLGLLEAYAPIPGWGIWGLRILLVRLGIWMVLSPLMHDHDPVLSGIYFGGGDAIILLTWWTVESLQNRLSPGELEGLFWWMGVGTSVLLLTYLNYASMAQLAGIFSAIIAVFGVGSLLFKRVSPGRSILPVLILLYSFIIIIGVSLSSRNLHRIWPLLLLIPLPAAYWFTQVPAFQRKISQINRVLISYMLLFLLGGILFLSSLPGDHVLINPFFPGDSSSGQKSKQEKTDDSYYDAYD